MEIVQKTILSYLEAELKEKKNIVVNISGRGDKDMHTVFSILKGGEIHE